MVACVSFGPSGMAIPKSATFADSGWLPAAAQISMLRAKWSVQLLMLPGVGFAVRSTLPAFKSPWLQEQ